VYLGEAAKRLLAFVSPANATATITNSCASFFVAEGSLRCRRQMKESRGIEAIEKTWNWVSEIDVKLESWMGRSRWSVRDWSVLQDKVSGIIERSSAGGA
jgi:hypothetical protein